MTTRALCVPAPRIAHSDGVLNASAIAQPSLIQKSKKSPVALATGRGLYERAAAQRTALVIDRKKTFLLISRLLIPRGPKGFTPIQRLGPSPGILWLVEPVTGPDKVIRRYDVVRRV